MDCIGALSKISMLGALLATNHAHTRAIFAIGPKTFIASEGDDILPGIQILAIPTSRRVTVKCSGETFRYFFWSENLPEPESEEPLQDVNIPLDPDPLWPSFPTSGEDSTP